MIHFWVSHLTWQNMSKISRCHITITQITKTSRSLGLATWVFSRFEKMKFKKGKIRQVLHLISVSILSTHLSMQPGRPSLSRWRRNRTFLACLHDDRRQMYISLYPWSYWCKYAFVAMDLKSGPWFKIKIPSYQYRKSHCGGKTILRPFYLDSGISYTGKMASLYWLKAEILVEISFLDFLLVIIKIIYGRLFITVRSRRIAVYFLLITHERHP